MKLYGILRLPSASLGHKLSLLAPRFSPVSLLASMSSIPSGFRIPKQKLILILLVMFLFRSAIQSCDNNIVLQFFATKFSLDFRGLLFSKKIKVMIHTAQKMKFSIKDFFSSFIFCTVSRLSEISNNPF